jgi:hypothetical protein
MYIAPTPNYTWRGENSPLQVTKWGENLGCVSILTPSPSIFRPGHRRENTPSTPRMRLGSIEETTHGRWARTALRWGRLTCGVGRSRVGSDHATFRLGDCQVGPQCGSRCIGRLKAVCSGCGPLNPCAEHVAVSISLGSASLQLMRCHVHMESYVLALCHAAWCGFYRAHMRSCAYLSHSGFDVCKWSIHFDRLDEPITVVLSKWTFGTVYDDSIFLPSIYLVSIASFHLHFNVSCNKR